MLIVNLWYEERREGEMVKASYTIYMVIKSRAV